MSWSSGLRLLASQRLWRRWTLASFLARLPVTMTLIALIFAGQQVTGSLAVGAQLAGVATFVSGVAATWRGRQLDRIELRGGLQRACLATAAVLTAQVAALLLGAPVAVLFVLAGAQGFASSAISGGFRALLIVAVPAEHLPRANVIEAVFVEVAFVAGPALAGALVYAVGPEGVIAAMALATAGAAVVARGLPTVRPAAVRTAAAPWRTPRARPVFALALSLGVCIGIFESALPARMEQLGVVAEGAGPLLAFMALGSGIGGLITSAHAERLENPRWPAVMLLTLFAVLLAPLALLASLPLLAAALTVAGMPIAPLNALGALRLQRTVPEGRQAEGFAVYIAAILMGAGVGQSVTGQLLDRIGPELLLVGSAALPLLAAVVVAAARPRKVTATDRALLPSGMLEVRPEEALE